MKYTDVNNVKVYTVNTDKTLPAWISDRQRRQLLKKDSELRSRINLIQDFEFPTSAGKVKCSKDGNYILATGVYKPRVNCYDTSQLAMKFTRYMTSEVVNFLILSDDFRKLVFLSDDRTIEVHAAFGYYYKTRIPRFGRDLTYNYENCDLYTVGASSEIYRLNLDEGIFQESFKGLSPEFNVSAMNPVHNLLGVGGTDGYLETWDPRSATRVNRLSVVENKELTSLAFHKGGLVMGVGTEDGKIMLYDIRNRKPMVVKDHQYGFPIKKIQFHGSGNVASADCKVIKIWNQSNGKAYTTVEAESDLNDFVIPGDSGLILTANETPKMNAFYIPDLGFAPKWCHHLDGITEELEENNDTAVYDDYQFVTRQELKKLGMDSLVGTNMLRAYMHGFFVDKRLYREAQAVAEPFAYEKYRKEQIDKKLKEKRENRIGVVKKMPKVNKAYAQHLQNVDDNIDSKASKKKKKYGLTSNPLQDDRFGALWKDSDFAIDTESEEYKLKHPQKATADVAQQFEAVEEDNDDNNMAIDDDQEINLRGSKEPKMYELKDGHAFTTDAEKLEKLKLKQKAAKAPLGLRLQSETGETTTEAGVRDRVFTVKLKKSEQVIERERKQKEHMKERRASRRSVKDLNLPKIRQNQHYGKK